MAVKPLVRKLLKITGVIAGILLVLLVIAYVWFVHHAENIIREIVHLKSKGKVELSLKSITYNFGQRRLDLKEAVLYNTDSAIKKTAYHVSVHKLSLQLHALMPLVLHRELIIDSILINHPDIRVMKSDTLEKRHGSLSREIGDLYHSIHRGLSLFSVGYFRVENGRLSLANRAREDWQPVTISNIYFRINNIRVGDDNKNAEPIHSDDIIFNTHHQQITFPDGRYRMAFSNFRIHVKDRMIALDSCSIVSTGRHQKQVAVNLFFDKLRFANIDFPALYAGNVIKADSMYALNPLLDLKVTADSAHRKNAPPVDIDTLLHHLGVNTQLKYMGVKNISTSVVTTQNGQSAELSTKGDDFEMRDLVIDRTAPKPVSVGRFDMAIRGYSSFNKDSTYSFKFDSIRIINSSILLNNFSINSLTHAAVKRHHQLPLFELDSLSWEELIFNRHIKAKQAVLYSPEIYYIKSTHTQPGKKASMYSLLNSLDNAMSLERIRVINGNVSFEPNPDTRLLLQQVNLTVSTNRLLAARSSSMMGNAVDSLHFENGSIQTKKLQATIHNGSFKGDGSRLEAGELIIHDRSGKMTVKAKGLRMDGLVFNDSNDHINVGSATWKEAIISIHTGTPAAPVATSQLPLTLNIQQVQGNNTHFTMTGPHHSITTYITSLKADGVSKEAGPKDSLSGHAVKLAGAAIRGTYLQYISKDMTLNTGSYDLAPMARSHIQDIRFTHYTPHDSITAAIPQLQLVPDMAAIMAGNLHAEEITLKEPTLLVKLSSPKAAGQLQQPSKPLPAMHIKKLVIEHPALKLEQQQEDHAVQLTWKRGDQLAHNQWSFTNIRHDGKGPLSIGKISIAGTDVAFARHSDREVFLKPQSIQLVLNNTSLATAKHHATPWKTTVEQFVLRDMQVAGIGKDSGRLNLHALSLENLVLQAQQHHREWLSNSPLFHLSDFSGDFTSNKDYFHWKQLSYHHPQRLLSVDSFTYTPVMDKEAYVAAHPYQTDYIQLRTSRIRMHHPDLHGYFRDTLAHITTLHVEKPIISVYRDKRPPREPNVIRPLPVTMLKNLQLRLKVDSILVHDGQVRYEELSEKTGRTGVIGISQLNASLAGIKSHDHHPADSLKLYADAYIMDSIRVNLRLHESYTDPLAAFHMTTKISPANLMVLNKVVEPLASVKIRSGHLDTLTLRAIGREHLSYGEMRMLYRKLNVQFLQAGDEEKRSFVTKMITFMANSFVIKSRNQHKTGIIYFERLRDRSIFNYMIKMLLSGAGSSVGAKSNKKYIKHYKRELRKQGLPPIHL